MRWSQICTALLHVTTGDRFHSFLSSIWPMLIRVRVYLGHTDSIMVSCFSKQFHVLYKIWICSRFKTDGFGSFIASDLHLFFFFLISFLRFRLWRLSRDLVRGVFYFFLFQSISTFRQVSMEPKVEKKVENQNWEGNSVWTRSRFLDVFYILITTWSEAHAQRISTECSRAFRSLRFFFF